MPDVRGNAAPAGRSRRRPGARPGVLGRSAGRLGEAEVQAIVDSVTTLDPGNPATVGVSFDVIEASWQALGDSIRYKLFKDASIMVGYRLIDFSDFNKLDLRKNLTALGISIKF